MGPSWYSEAMRPRFGSQLRREVDEVVVRHSLAVERGGPGGKRLRRRGLLAGHRRGRHRALLDRPDRLAGDPVEHVGERLLGHLRHGLDLPAVDGDVDERRRGRDVVVPDAVVDELVVPDALAGPGVQAHQALREQVVAGPMAAVEIVGGRLDRQIHVAQLQVGRHRCPHPGVAAVAPGVVLPGLVAELARLGDGVEDPQLLAGARVEPADEPGREVGRRRGGAQRRPDHDHVADDQRRRVQADLAGLDWRTVRPVVDALEEIDDALLAEGGHRVSGRGVQRDQVISPGDVDDPRVVLPVRPVRHAPARAGPHRRDVAALAFVEAVHPQRLAGGPVDGRDVAPLAGRGVEHPADHQRRRLVVEVDAGAEVVRPPPPRDLEVGDVVAVDLIEGRVLGAPRIRAVVPPLAVAGALLRRGNAARGEQDGDRDQTGPDTPVYPRGHVVLLFFFKPADSRWSDVTPSRVGCGHVAADPVLGQDVGRLGRLWKLAPIAIRIVTPFPTTVQTVASISRILPLLSACCQRNLRPLRQAWRGPADSRGSQPRVPAMAVSPGRVVTSRRPWALRDSYGASSCSGKAKTYSAFPPSGWKISGRSCAVRPRNAPPSEAGTARNCLPPTS